ncbi:gamma-glutamyl transpeptidase 1 [Perilla frutescens var. frutescens]|nr:gamma-glutamyl transpeptidase 1 [Perilla frutescens var. frutescens]
MDAYGKQGMIREMELVLARMKSKKIKPDIITFNLLIDAYGRKQEFDKMEQVFKSLLRSKEKPTLPTFNSMITNYGKARLREKADSVYQKMIEMGYKPSFITYECLIMMYGYCDRVSRAREIFDQMVESEKERKVSTLNALLDVYCRNGLPMEADMLFESAHATRMFPVNSTTYKLLYKAYTKADMKELVEKLLVYMDKDGILPNKRFFLDALGALGSSSSSKKSTILREPSSCFGLFVSTLSSTSCWGRMVKACPGGGGHRFAIFESMMMTLGMLLTFHHKYFFPATCAPATYVSQTPQGGRLKAHCRSSWRNAKTRSCHEFTPNILSCEQHDSLSEGDVVPVVDAQTMSWMTSLWQFVLLSSLSLFSIISCERISAEHAVVATDHGLCSRIGRDVLLEGGHAVDAAVAAALCLGVVSPASSGIGGGAFMLVRAHGGETEAYDMRETAPKHASKNMYAGNANLKASGALSVAVPGELAGLTMAWRKHGRLPWRRLVAPAARIAKNGFKISPYLHMQMVSSESSIMLDDGLRGVFTSNGSLLKPGDVCYNEQLSKTLSAIARAGTKAFYNGSIGLSLVKDVKKAGGMITMEDLQHYNVKLRRPVKMDVMGVEIFGMPPPSSGGACMALILNILAQYKEDDSLSDISSSLMIHREIEALKNAFAVRMSLGDPDFVDVQDVLKDMLSEEFAAKLRRSIFDNTTFNSSHYGYGGRWRQMIDHGTSHISIVDRQRNAVSMTTTINSYFGSKFLSETTGIILNNEMDDFSIPANETPSAPPANFIHPGKRPLSSMAPTIVLKGGKLKAVVGASGGGMIIAGTTEVLLNHLARGMDPLSSVLAPRAYHQLIPNVLQYENWTVPTGEHFEVRAETRAELAKKGHVLQSLAGGTICQFVLQEMNASNAGLLIGVSDPRKGGFPFGF